MSEKGVKIADEHTKVRYVLAGWQRQGDYKTSLLQVKMERVLHSYCRYMQQE